MQTYLQSQVELVLRIRAQECANIILHTLTLIVDHLIFNLPRVANNPHPSNRGCCSNV